LHNNFLGPWQTRLFWRLIVAAVAGWLWQILQAEQKNPLSVNRQLYIFNLNQVLEFVLAKP
jgi:hypothetical protein